MDDQAGGNPPPGNLPDGHLGVPDPLGVLGVGAIGEAIITGLGHHASATTSLIVSPRSQRRTEALAQQFPFVRVAADNQAVIDQSRTILVCLRPHDAADVLQGLRFRADHLVISVVAAVPLEEMAQWVTPGNAVARAIPLPAVAERQGLTAIYPPEEHARELFDRLGTSMCVDDEALLDSMSAATATIAAHMAYLATISEWLTSRGLSADEAQRYVAATFAPFGDTLRELPIDLDHLASDHATPGGLNEQFLTTLRDADAFGLVRRTLDEVEARVRRRSSD